MAAFNNISDQPGLMARVPEHSLPLMTAMSDGAPLVIDGYLFFHAQNWLTAIGYPLAGSFDKNKFAAAAKAAQAQTGAENCFAIAPRIPEELEADIVEKDRYYVLPAAAAIPPRLRNYVKNAAAKLQVRQSASFTPGHRRLWAEFLGQNSANMNGRVAELYARAPHVAGKADGEIFFLDAVDENGNLAASLLLDCSQELFTSYILGAHSRKNYAPHATDLLFAKMLELSRRKGKKFVHLGLGVNDGILRFKKKWGAITSYSFTMAQWQGKGEKEVNAALAMSLAILRSSGGVSARQFLENEPEQRPFAMIWRVEKNNRVSWVSGTAHFFLHSFESSFRKLFRNVDNVIFEGPLDPDFMAKVDEAGKIQPPGFTPLIELLSEAEIKALEKTVNGGQPRLPAFARIAAPSRNVDVRWLLRNGMPWYAFFTLWTSYLERLGWKQSVDMEAWRVAQDMGKNVIGMESLEEQLESLGSLPVERAINFFRSCSGWKQRARNNLSAYLAGDLEKMMGSSAEFPTRTEHIVGRRDQRFRERMRPYLEQGRAAVFVGSAHMVNLRHMLAEDGFTVTQAPFGLWPKIHLNWRRLTRPDGKVTW